MNLGFLGLDSAYTLDPVALLALAVSVYAVILSRRRAQLDNDILRADFNLAATKLRSALQIALPIVERNPSSLDFGNFSRDCELLKSFDESFRQSESLITKSFPIAPKLADDMLLQVGEIKQIFSMHGSVPVQSDEYKKVCHLYRSIFFILSQFSKPVSLIDNYIGYNTVDYESLFIRKYFEFEKTLNDIADIEWKQLRAELQRAADELKRH